MEDRLVTVAEFSTAFDAELAKVRLENEGIEAIVLGGDLVANMYTIDAIKIELQVFEKDVERAEAVLASPPDEEESDEDSDFDDDEDADFDDDEDAWEEDEEADEDFDAEGDEPQ